MSDTTYTPPKVWTWDSKNGGAFAKVNRPYSGATHTQNLPKGEHRFQLYSMGTPNGVKVTTMFEELLELGIDEAEYDAYLIRIHEGDQFGSGFVELNPNSKIPALWDEKQQQRIFESGSILMYLAETFGKFLPASPAQKTETLNWLFWQVGSAPFLGGGFGHFYNYAPERYAYPINRYTMEVKRQLDVLDKQLARHPYMAGDEYTIADIAIWPWYGKLCLGKLYNAAEFLDVTRYQHLQRWAHEIARRPAVVRGNMVNNTAGEPSSQLPERHSAKDFDTLRNTAVDIG